MSDKNILQGHKAVPVDDLLEWDKAFQDMNREVLFKFPKSEAHRNYSNIPPGNGPLMN
jgi:hypothetical protein